MLTNTLGSHPVRRTLALALACAPMLTPLSAVAQAASGVQAGAAASEFPISGFELTGEIPLSSAETSTLLAPFIGPQGSLAKLQKATSALEAALSERGYALYRVSLPPQQLGNKVTLNIVKFVIGKVTVDGLHRLDAQNVRTSVPEVREGQAPNFKTLAVQTAIANENPGKQLQVVLKESAEPDKIDVNLKVTEGPAWSGALSASNTGSESTGRDRVALTLGHSNLWNLDHQLALAATTSLEQRNAVKQFGVTYRMPLYGQGAVIGASYTNSDVVGDFGTFTSTGAGSAAALSYSLFVQPHGGYRGFWTAGLEDKRFSAGKLSGIAIPGQLDRSSRPLSFGYNARMDSDQASWGYTAELATNLAGGPGSDLAAYQSEDARIASERWQALRGGANYQAPIAGGWAWSARLQWQWSRDALIAGEQFGLGGMASVRGTGERVTAGDSGALINLEVSTPVLAPGLRLLGFVDAGWLRTNNAAATTAGKVESDQLASAGLGLRYNSASLGLSADWGSVLNGATQPVGQNLTLPAKGDSKLHFAVTARF